MVSSRPDGSVDTGRQWRPRGPRGPGLSIGCVWVVIRNRGPRRGRGNRIWSHSGTRVLVPQRDQSTGPTAGLVPQRDQRWSHSGTELVPERDTIPPTPPTPHTPHTRPAAPIGENDGENDDGSTAAPTPETAQTILAELVDHCAAGGVTLTSRIRGQYASAIKSALADGIAADTIRQALAGMIRDHVIDRPSWLDSRIVQAQTGPEIRRRPTTVTDQRHAQADAALAEVLAEMHT